VQNDAITIMKSYIVCILSVFAVMCVSALVNAFTIPSSSTLSRSPSLLTTTSSTTRLNFFGGPKDDGSPGDYKCLDCDYVFTKGPKAWAELPDNWSCPECGSVKRRFKKIPKGSGGKGKDAAPKKKGVFGF
jgi:rubredoxin